MSALPKTISVAVDDEYGRASKKFGAANNSPHESYAVILEEYDEAMNEASTFEDLQNLHWSCVKQNESTVTLLVQMQEAAERAAAEWVQVAAMCYKARRGL